MKVLVVDDEAPARRYLAGLVKQLGAPYELAGEAANGEEAVNHCLEHPVDVVLMDIRMPGMDGLEAARRIADLPLPPAVIFTTAYEEHALSAFDVRGAGYLLKPVRSEKLKAALEQAARPTRLTAHDKPESEAGVTVRYRGRLERIPLSSIYYFKADSKYVVVRHEDGDVLIEESLKTLESRFGDQVVRVHRGVLVVPGRLRALEKSAGGNAWLTFNGIEDRVEVSRRHLPVARRLLR